MSSLALLFFPQFSHSFFQRDTSEGQVLVYWQLKKQKQQQQKLQIKHLPKSVILEERYLI